MWLMQYTFLRKVSHCSDRGYKQRSTEMSKVIPEGPHACQQQGLSVSTWTDCEVGFLLFFFFLSREGNFSLHHLSQSWISGTHTTHREHTVGWRTHEPKVICACWSASNRTRRFTMKDRGWAARDWALAAAQRMRRDAATLLTSQEDLLTDCLRLLGWQILFLHGYVHSLSGQKTREGFSSDTCSEWQIWFNMATSSKLDL